MVGQLTLVGEELALDWLFSSASVTRPTAWYVGLHAGSNGGNGGANELLGNGYVRQPLTFVRVGNVMSNTGLLLFGPCVTSAWGMVTDVTLWNAQSGGACYAEGQVDSPVTYLVGEAAIIAVGSLTLTLT